MTVDRTQDFAIAVFVLSCSTSDGRLGSPGSRIAALVLVALGPLELAWLAFLPAEGPGVPANLLAFWPSAETADAIDSVQRALLASAQLALAVLIARRWRRASAARRRVLMPALVGSAALFFFTAIFIVDKIAEQVPADIIWLYFVVFTSVPIAMLAQLVQARFAHTASATCSSACAATSRPSSCAAPSPARCTTRRSGRILAAGVRVVSRHDGQPCRSSPAPRAGHADRRDGKRSPRSSTTTRCWPTLAARRDHGGRGLRARKRPAAGRAAGPADELRARGRGSSRHQTSARAGAQPARRRAAAACRALTRAGDCSRPATGPTRGAGTDRRAARRADESRPSCASSPAAAPGGATDHGLAVALEGLVARAPLPVQLQLRLHERLPAPRTRSRVYLVSESLTNVTKYAHASAVTVEVARTNGELVGEVVDDGCGGPRERRLGLRGLGLSRGGARRPPARVEAPKGRHPRTG